MNDVGDDNIRIKRKIKIIGLIIQIAIQVIIENQKAGVIFPADR